VTWRTIGNSKFFLLLVIPFLLLCLLFKPCVTKIGKKVKGKVSKYDRPSVHPFSFCVAYNSKRYDELRVMKLYWNVDQHV
jgi:hypothetical protein